MNAAELLTELVNFRTDEREAEQAVFMARLLESWGARVTLQEVAAGRPNLISTFSGRNAARSILLEAHGDTVSPAVEPHRATLQDGRLHGRGACDNKGSITAMLLAIHEILQRNGRFPVTVHFVCTCDEEQGATGARALMESGFRADCALVGEPTDLKIVYAHKGALRLVLRTSGVAAHSSTPERGVNAIYKMRPVLERLERWQPRSQHPVLGVPTLSVGTIRGGTEVNVVPASCEIQVDRRLVPGESPAEIVAELTSGLEVQTELKAFYPPLDTPTTIPLAQALARACRETMGQAEFVTAPFASNAGVFAEAGIPSLLFGPGTAAHAHTQHEFIELSEVTAAARVYARLLQDPFNEGVLA